jgi:hypothetical protein
MGPKLKIKFFDEIVLAKIFLKFEKMFFTVYEENVHEEILGLKTLFGEKML